MKIKNRSKIERGNKMDNKDKEIIKALDGSATQGADFIDDELAKRYIKYVEERNFCRQLFRTEPMAAKTKNIPKILTGFEVSAQTVQNTSADETDLTTGTIQLVAKNLAAFTTITDDQMEDADQNMTSLVRDGFAAATARAEERAMLLGDISHAATAVSRSAATAVNWFIRDPRTIFNGLFVLAQGTDAQQLNIGGDMTVDIVNQVIYYLGKYADDPNQIVMFVNRYSAYQLRGSSELITIDKYGPNATIVKGEIGKVMGVSIVESGHAPSGLAVATPRQNPIIGDRRMIKSETDRRPRDFATDYIVSERIDFQVEFPDALAYVYNLTEAPTS